MPPIDSSSTIRTIRPIEFVHDNWQYPLDRRIETDSEQNAMATQILSVLSMEATVLGPWLRSTGNARFVP